LIDWDNDIYHLVAAESQEEYYFDEFEITPSASELDSDSVYSIADAMVLNLMTSMNKKKLYL